MAPTPTAKGDETEQESTGSEEVPLPSFELTPLPKREAPRGPPPPPSRKAASAVPRPAPSGGSALPSVPSQPEGDAPTLVRATTSTLPPARLGAEPDISAPLPPIPSPAPVPEELTSTPAFSALARLSAFADARRGLLPEKLRSKLSGVSGSTLALGAVALGVLLVAGLGAGVLTLYRTLVSTDASTASAPSAQSSAASAVSSAAPAAGDRETEGENAPVREAKTEAEILLDHAERLLGAGRDAAALPVIDRLIAREPELKRDARLKRVLSKIAASSDARAAADAFAMLKGPMGEEGAAIVYELSLQEELRPGTRKRAQYWLTTKEFARTSSLELYAAVKLRQAKTCEDKHALLRFAGNAGGKYVLDYLRELDEKTVCSPEALDDCYPCLRNDNRLTSTIEKLKAGGAG